MSIGNTSLHQSGEIPEIVKLPNGRIRVTRRFHKFTREDIDNANLGSLMGDFGDLDTAGEQISNQGYTNCRLISVEVDPSFRFNSVSNTDSAVLVKTYETLTDSFVQITDDTVTFTDNGLKQITRVYRAVSGTTSSNVVGTTALNTGETLASSRIEDSKAFAELTETYIESGVLSRTTDLVGSQNAITVEVFNPSEIPSPVSNFFYIQPDGTSLYLQPDDVSLYLQIEGEISHLLANVQESNVDGIPTKRYTFLKPSILSQSEDKVGSQLAITIEAFGEVPATPAGYSLARTDVSDFEGIKTNRYTFLRPSIISVQQDFNNGLKRVSVQAFNLDSAAVSAALSEVTVDHKLIATNESDYEGIKTTTFQYQIDETFTEDYELNGLKRISLIELSTTNFTAISIGSQGDTDTPQFDLYLATQDIDNGGIIKVRESTWLEAGILNVQRRSESEGVYRVTTTFLGAQGTVVGPIVAKSEDNYDGLKTIAVVHMQKADGTSLIDNEAAIVTHNSLSEFSYPGIVTISNELLGAAGNTYSFLAKDFKLDPPSVALIPSVTKVFFKTTNSITYSSNHSLWSPKTWAQGGSRGIAWNYLPFSNTQAFRGYRIDTTANNSYFALGQRGSVGTATPWDMISGKRIYARTRYRIEVSGGPPNPVGNNYTLSYNIAHAFSDIDGTPYYKHTEVISTIPAKI
jgi:hypothetical protein